MIFYFKNVLLCKCIANVVQYRSAASIVNNRRVRRLSHRNKRPQPDANSSFLLDNEKYVDHDFDFNTVQQNNTKNVFTELRNVNNRNDTKRKQSNALFDDDDEDRKLAKTIRSSEANQKFLKLKHTKFEKEFKNKLKLDRGNFNESEAKDAKLNAKQNRPKVPLPYDLTPENRFEILNKTVIPFADVPYPVQLKQKWEVNFKILKFLGEQIKSEYVRLGHNKLPCSLEPVRPSPRTEHYRNKDEFSIWPGIDGNSKTVGFFVGQPSKHEKVICVEPDHIFISKPSHLEYVRKFQTYLREISPYDSCQNFGVGGNWRRFHIRSNEALQHMITAVMHPQDLTEQQLEEEMGRLRKYFSNDSAVHSLYLHTSLHTRSTHTDSGRYYHLLGEKTITETLFDKQFVISPDSFFQINTAAAEVLYRVILTEINARKSSTILDLCCGTGTLSVLLSGYVKKVIAIDSSASAIEDAKRNAQLNDCHNIEFHCGSVEDILPKLRSSEHLPSDLIAVANPSRRAFRQSVIRLLREMEYIRRIVYVSCKPQGDAFRNFVYLCHNNEPNQFQYLPVNAVPVDLFPHTSHCELVVTFERFN